MHAHAQPKPEVHLFSFAVLFPFIFIEDVRCCSQELRARCMCVDVVRSTHLPSWICAVKRTHTRINGFAFENKIHHRFVCMCFSSYKFFINCLVFITMVECWLIFFILFVVCQLVDCVWLLMFRILGCFAREKKHQNKTKFAKLTLMVWVEQSDGNYR